MTASTTPSRPSPACTISPSPRDRTAPHTPPSRLIAAFCNTLYAASATRFLDHARETGEILLPGDGPVAWTTHADLAEATAAILADEGRFEGPTPSLTASRALSFDDLAALATEVTGRTFTRSTAPEAGFRDHLVAQGVPAHYADQVLGIFAAARAGEFAVPDPTLGALLGREPVGMREVLGEALGRPSGERPAAG